MGRSHSQHNKKEEEEEEEEKMFAFICLGGKM
jgi:hypothetical protein